MLSRSLVFAVVPAAVGCASAPPPPLASVERACPPSVAEPEPELSIMDLDHLHTLLREVDRSASRSGGTWQLGFQGVPLMVLTDVRADRMRIVVPIAPVERLTPELVEAAMNANFHTALDARYAIGEGVLFAAFIHRLSTLHPSDVRSAVRQTATLAATFGSEFTSGEMVFGAPVH